MKRTVLSLLVAGAVAAGAAPPPEETVVTADQDVVRVEGVRVQDDTVSGVIVNTSDRPVSDLRVLIVHEWRWRDEFNPGRDSPGRATLYTVNEEIPPHGQVRFTAPLGAPLPERRDGHFETRGDVVSFVQTG